MKHWPLLAFTLLLACCGGGENSANQPTAPVKVSRLQAFDTAGLDEGLTLPDFTNYWTLAEKRNGNSYPVKASITDEAVMALRLDAKGGFAARTDKWVGESLPTIGRKVEAIGKKYWNSEKEASAAAVVLFADSRAPYTPLLQLCRELVDLQVRNLWLVTRDKRDGSTRLLPLKVDTDQLFREWYFLTPEESQQTLLVSKTEGFSITRRDTQLVWSTDDWPTALGRKFPAASRIQFELANDARIDEFAKAANLMAPVGFIDVEPFWPVLDKGAGSEGMEPKRDLPEYGDEFGIATSLDAPTLSEYWRAVAANERLPAPATIDNDSPMLGLRVAADGSLSTRAPGEPEWTLHADDLEFVQALQRNAGEVDFDTGASTLQLVMCMDRNANWEVFLGVLEMMISAACHRLYVVTNDVIGPTLRLLDLSLPFGGVEEGAKVATILLAREGIVADEEYDLTFELGEEKHEYSGARYASSLRIWSADREFDPDVLVVKLPRDEPFETLFTVLNGVAWLGMKSIRIGG